MFEQENAVALNFNELFDSLGLGLKLQEYKTRLP